jgi:ferrochelatase
VLLTCHGTVSCAEDIPAFLANIRRGRPTPAAIIEEVRHRFAHIGGSPLMRITALQARALEERLGIAVHVAGRLWHPYPSEVIGRLVADGVTRLISLPLAPQSVDVYHAVVREAAAAHPDLQLHCVPPWGLTPELIDAFVEAIDEGLDLFPPDRRSSVAIVLSAHSLPQRIIDAGDAYERQFRQMAGLVALRVQKGGPRVRIAFQSQGMSADAWLGPDLRETFADLAAEGAQDVLISPIGFVADHTETLYDLDVEARILAEKSGLSRMERTPAMNTRPRFIDALEVIARRALAA